MHALFLVLSCAISYQNDQGLSISGATVTRKAEASVNGSGVISYSDEAYMYKANVKAAAFGQAQLSIQDISDETDKVEFEGFLNPQYVFRVKRLATGLIIRGQKVQSVTFACNIGT
jgi:hypothetical protein